MDRRFLTEPASDGEVDNDSRDCPSAASPRRRGRVLRDLLLDEAHPFGALRRHQDGRLVVGGGVAGRDDPRAAAAGRGAEGVARVFKVISGAASTSSSLGGGGGLLDHGSNPVAGPAQPEMLRLACALQERSKAARFREARCAALL